MQIPPAFKLLFERLASYKTFIVLFAKNMESINIVMNESSSYFDFDFQLLAIEQWTTFWKTQKRLLSLKNESCWKAGASDMCKGGKRGAPCRLSPHLEQAGYKHESNKSI